ncbi:MAG: N-acetylmuramoyl-L-alanine amidase [Firmicutes bacterium]|nr:N-acetylmuramoyl-L-alanine amidase [Bacillota bacterium]
MKFSKSIFSGVFFFLTLIFMPCTTVVVSAAERLQPVEGDPVIVIDPGHGGENMGTQAGGIWDEKYMDMVTAQALYDELSLYDNVKVYLTRTTDVDMSFQERAAFAQSVDADFLFSIHYNASENHNLFGSEVWVPLSAPFNNYGYQIGYELLTGMQEKGLLVRGIKTRKGDRGEYYAIIRETVALDIPAAIIEHCHVDEDRDKGYCDSEEDLIQFGKDDATAIAKYFGLKSSILNVDYSEYQLVDITDSAPIASTLRDETPPDVCQIEFSEADYDAGYLSLTVSAADYDSPLLYYTYSIDGGQTYSERKVWPGSDVLAGKYDDTFTLSLAIPTGTKPSVIVRAYNLFDPYTESNRYDSPETFYYNELQGPDVTEAEGTAGSGPDAPDLGAEGGTDAETAAAASGENGDTALSAPDTTAVSGSAVAADKEPVSFVTFLEICLVIVIFLFVILLVSQGIAYHNRRKRRRQSRNDLGENRNQHR